MDGSGNVIVEYQNKRYHILYVGIHGGSGFGANYPYDGRYYLVRPEIWEKEHEKYCCVHDSGLPQAWAYYEGNGVFLMGGNDYHGPVTDEILQSFLSRLEPELLDILGEAVTE